MVRSGHEDPLSNIPCHHHLLRILDVFRGEAIDDALRVN